MNVHEYLLTCLAEECAEVIKNATKALRFGLESKDPRKHTQSGMHATNRVMIARELTDVMAIAELLLREGTIPPYFRMIAMRKKQNKLRQLMREAYKDGVMSQELEEKEPKGSRKNAARELNKKAFPVWIP